MRHLPGRRLLLSVAAALVAAGAIAGIAYATGVVGGSDSGTVTVCVKKAGDMRYVATAAQCKKDEHAVLLAAAAAAQPTDFTVDCTRGQTIQAVLDRIANGTQPVAIHVDGDCGEDVSVVVRDNVSIDGASTDAGVRSLYFGQSRNGAVSGLAIGVGGLMVDDSGTVNVSGVHVTGSVHVEGGSRLNIGDESTLDGGLDVLGGVVDVGGGTIAHGDEGAVECRGGTVTLHDVLVTDSPWDGVDARGTCSIDIDGGTVQNSNSAGVAAWQGASISVEDGAVIAHNQMHAGALAQAGGTLSISDSFVRDNNRGVGVSGFAGGHVSVGNSTIENNAFGGISISGGSSIEIDGTTVSGNHGDGIGLFDTSVLVANGGNTITGNTGWGIWCQPAPAVAQISGWNLGQVGTVSDNGSGQVTCPLSGQPGP